MWADRQYSYVPPSSSGFPRSMMRDLLISLIAVSVLQFVGNLLLEGGVTEFFGLSRLGLSRGYIWQPVSYIWLHGGLLHLLLNLLGLYVFGRDLEQVIGSRSFLRLFIGSGLAGGLGWIVLSGSTGAVCIGASGAVFGILGAFTAFYPERRITLLVFFVLPVTLAAKWLALGLAVFTLFSLMGGGGQVAHAAHLAGGVVGYIYARQRQGLGWLPYVGGGSFFKKLRMRRSRRRFTMMHDNEDLPPSPEIIDEILEKLHRRGLRSLTERERRILDRASRHMR